MSGTNRDRPFFNSVNDEIFYSPQPPPPRQSSLPPLRRREFFNNSAKKNSSIIGRQRYPSFNSYRSSRDGGPLGSTIGTQSGNSQKSQNSSIIGRQRYPSFNSYRSSRDGGPLQRTYRTEPGNSTEGNLFYNRRYENANAEPCSCRSSEAGPLQETYRTEPGNSIREIPYNRDKLKSIEGNTPNFIHKARYKGIFDRGNVNKSKNGLKSIEGNTSAYFRKRLPTLENRPPIDNSAYSPRPSSQVSRQQINSPISRSRSQINSPMSDNSAFNRMETTEYRNSIKLPLKIPFEFLPPKIPNEKNTLKTADGNFQNFILSSNSLIGYNAITYILEPMLLQLKSSNYKYAYLYIEKGSDNYTSPEINYIATEDKIYKADKDLIFYGICELDFDNLDYINDKEIISTINKSKIFIDSKYMENLPNITILSNLNKSITGRGVFHLSVFKPGKPLLGGIRKRNTKKYLKTDKIYIDKCKITRKVYESNGNFFIKKKSKKTEKFQYRKINLKS
jgi:hypothetical protein